MKNKPLLAFLTLLAILFAYSVYKFFATHEYREVTEYTSFKGEARENPLFAARLFLRQMGIPAENKNNLQSLGNNFPDTHTAMILDTSRTTLSLKRADRLLDWVRAGGHLITGAHYDSELTSYFYDEALPEDEYGDEEEEEQKQAEEDEEDKDTVAKNYCPDNATDSFSGLIADNYDEEEVYSKDPIQSVLGVLVLEGIFLDNEHDDSNENDDLDARQITFSSWRNYKDHVEYDIALDGVEPLLTLALENFFYAIYSPFENTGNNTDTSDNKNSTVLIQNEPFLLQRRMGKGQITLVSDLSIFENQLLRYADNAEILWHLLHTDNRQPNAVWLFHNDEMPNLFVLIWKYGWMVVLTLLALLLFWLYQSLQRFGPIIPTQELARRRLIEHIDASGHYFWKTNNKQLLIDSTRQALNQRIAQLHPGWHNSDNNEKVQHLAGLLNRPVEDIKKLLFTATPENDEDFVTLIKELETLRKHL